MFSRRRLLLLIAAVAVVALAWFVMFSRAPNRETIDAPELAHTGAARPRPAAEPRTDSIARVAATTPPAAAQATRTPTIGTALESVSPTPPSDDAAKTPRVASLGLQAAEEYRKQAQYPPWSHPLADGEDPILRDREVSPITAAGPNGEEPVLTVFPDQVSFEAPDAVTLYAFLTVGDERVPAEEITAVVVAEDQRPVWTLGYRDDGEGGDAAAGDLIYTGRFEPGPDFYPDLAGSFLVRVRAITTDQRERIAATGFLYSNPYAQLTGRYRDAIVGGSLVIEAEVAVLRPGRFHLEATLYSEDGRRGIAEAQTAAEFPVGVQWMRLTFFGRILAQSGIDGPYLLRFVALSTTTQMPNAKNRLAEKAYVTGPYRASQFSDAPFNDPDLLDAANNLQRDAQE